MTPRIRLHYPPNGTVITSKTPGGIDIEAQLPRVEVMILLDDSETAMVETHDVFGFGQRVQEQAGLRMHGTNDYGFSFYISPEEQAALQLTTYDQMATLVYNAAKRVYESYHK